MKEEVKIYKGIKLIQNPLTGNWFLFFNKVKYPSQPPYAGPLSAMKDIINIADKKNRLDDFNKES